MQGFCTGAGLIVGRAIVRDLYDGPHAQKVMSLITLFFGVAPALAPVIGGFVFNAAGWHAVFGFLALYGALLWVLCWKALPETHPVALRSRFAPRPLLRTYGRVSRDGRFLLLALATGFNFGAFFLYISSAPAFVQTLLGLGTLGYPWFFVPCIAGMMTGATLSNRLAGRLAPRATVKLGYAIMGMAMTLNLAYNALAPTMTIPWAVLPVALNSVGVSLVFPTLSIKMLDRYPRRRWSRRAARSRTNRCERECDAGHPSDFRPTRARPSSECAGRTSRGAVQRSRSASEDDGRPDIAQRWPADPRRSLPSVAGLRP